MNNNILNNRYIIEKVLGQGGMGKVYLAFDQRTGERVAVKECFVSVNSPSTLVERIHREYYYMNKIKHPNIVQAIDFFPVGQSYCIVMEYVNGVDIKSFICKHRYSISLKKQIDIAIQICDAVAELNENDIIHRDIKPANIMLCGENLQPKLLDLGIAKTINSELSSLTKTGNIVGTPQYISPEQIEGKTFANTDVFLLGTLFYQFFSWSDNSPFDGGNAVSSMDKVCNFSPPPLFSENSSVLHLRIATIIENSLQKEIRQRTMNVRRLRRAFQECLILNGGKVINDQKIFFKENEKTSIPSLKNNGVKTKEFQFAFSKIEYLKFFLSIVLVLVICYVFQMEKPNGEQASIEEKLPINNFFSTLDKCWVTDKGYFDFTNNEWAKLNIKEQGEYAREYQKWYAQNNSFEIEKTFVVNDVKFDMVLIPPGKYFMGTQKKVEIIKKAFWVGKTEVTQEQWQIITGNNPSYFKNPKNPVENVSWTVCNEFCEKNGFSLLSEVEYEYVCRGGTTTDWYGNMDDIAWYLGNSQGRIHVVAQKQPNGWNVYDTLGNVSEWCQGSYLQYKIYRGGSCTSAAGICLSTSRREHEGGYGRKDFIGFRVAKFTINSFSSVLEKCWIADKGCFDFTSDDWVKLSAKEQGRYAGEYQKWYAQNNGLEIEKTFAVNGAEFGMVLIPPGKYLMGKGKKVEVIEKAFWIGKTEVTQEQWEAVMGNNPSYFKNPKNPVENVSWNECNEFCKKNGFELLGEVQWEYICRAGTTADHYGDIGDVAWYIGNSEEKTHVVAQKQPNGWKVYDILGNVWEWCKDDYSKGYKIFCGGGCRSSAKNCFSIYRRWFEPGFCGGDLGFRVSRSIN